MNKMTNGGGNRRIHPGSGRRKAPVFPKGRLLKPEEGEAVAKLLGDRPRRRDLLIEYLHLIQDSEGCLPAGLLQALGVELKIAMAEVYEVASFYAHFDIVRDEEERPAPVTVRVCDSLSCMLAGAEELITALEKDAPDTLRVLRAPCMGRCDTAPVCEAGHRHLDHVTAEDVLKAAEEGHLHPEIPSFTNFEAYEKDGGYSILKQCISGELSVEKVVELLSDAGLRGLGGAGFPTGRKWGLVRAEAGPRLMAVNADEGEPGTFKDRYYLETNPHAFLEGMLIGAWAVEAEAVYIYLRDEYPAVREILLHGNSFG